MAPSDRLHELVETLSNHLCRHVVPIYKDDDRGRPSQFGSGLLVAGPQGSFLVSAAHVLEPIRNGKSLYFYARPGHKLPLPPLSVRIDGARDVGVLRLEGPLAPPYVAVEKLPLPIGALMPSALPRTGKQYCALGFPGSRSRVDRGRRRVEAKPYANLCRSAPEDRYADLGLSAGSIVLEFNRNSVRGAGWRKQSFPKPGGMSGSPVWMMWNVEGENDPAQTPVVAILVERLERERVLVATDVKFALEMIRQGM